MLAPAPPVGDRTLPSPPRCAIPEFGRARARERGPRRRTRRSRSPGRPPVADPAPPAVSRVCPPRRGELLRRKSSRCRAGQSAAFARRGGLGPCAYGLSPPRRPRVARRRHGRRPRSKVASSKILRLPRGRFPAFAVGAGGRGSPNSPWLRPAFPPGRGRRPDHLGGALDGRPPCALWWAPPICTLRNSAECRTRFFLAPWDHGGRPGPHRAQIARLMPLHHLYM